MALGLGEYVSALEIVVAGMVGAATYWITKAGVDQSSRAAHGSFVKSAAVVQQFIHGNRACFESEYAMIHGNELVVRLAPYVLPLETVLLELGNLAIHLEAWERRALTELCYCYSGLSRLLEGKGTEEVELPRESITSLLEYLYKEDTGLMEAYLEFLEGYDTHEQDYAAAHGVDPSPKDDRILLELPELHERALEKLLSFCSLSFGKYRRLQVCSPPPRSLRKKRNDG